MAIIIPSYDLGAENLPVFSFLFSTIAFTSKKLTTYYVEAIWVVGVQFSVLLKLKHSFPPLDPQILSACEKNLQMPISSIMTCTTLSTSVLHLTRPIYPWESQWRNVRSGWGPAIPPEFKGQNLVVTTVSTVLRNESRILREGERRHIGPLVPCIPASHLKVTLEEIELLPPIFYDQ